MFATPPDPVAARPSWLVILLGCLTLAVISLFVLPRGIAYDPWSWLIWGREIGHLSLDTRGAATAVKPFPIAVNTLLAFTGSLAPVLWLVLARALALLSLALAYRIAYRLGGVGAGVVAAVGLAVSGQFLGYLFVSGMSEPIAAAAILAAIDSYLQSRPRATFGWLIAAGLLRPEAWPFLIAYSVWLAYRRRSWQRIVGVGVAVAVPFLWFVIDWFGSRQFFRSAGAATQESQGGPLLTKQPGLATLRETWHLMSGPMVVLFLLGFAVAVVAWLRSGHRRALSAPLWLGLGAFAWLVVDAILAQGRFATGAPRYLLPGAALACVVAGVFVTDLIRTVARLRAGFPRLPAAATLVFVVLAILLGPRFAFTGRAVHIGVEQSRQLAGLRANLPRAIALAGGRDAVVQCGRVSTEAFQVPVVAWELRLPVGDLGADPGATGVVFAESGAPRVPAALSAGYHDVGSVGSGNTRWTVFTTCPSR